MRGLAFRTLLCVAEAVPVVRRRVFASTNLVNTTTTHRMNYLTEQQSKNWSVKKVDHL